MSFAPAFCGPVRIPDYNQRAMSSMAPLPDLYLYGRPDCGLCDESRAVIRLLLDDRRARDLPTPALVERDIDTDPHWQHDFFASIPVVELGTGRVERATSVAKLRRLLAEQLDGSPG